MARQRVCLSLEWCLVERLRRTQPTTHDSRDSLDCFDCLWNVNAPCHGSLNVLIANISFVWEAQLVSKAEILLPRRKTIKVSAGAQRSPRLWCTRSNTKSSRTQFHGACSRISEMPSANSLNSVERATQIPGRTTAQRNYIEHLRWIRRWPIVSQFIVQTFPISYSNVLTRNLSIINSIYQCDKGFDI